MNIRSIEEKDYDFLLELDKKVYPTDSPVTPEILNEWYQRNNEFGILFEENEIQGMCIVIPLNKNGWERLTKGELLESELSSETIFDNSRDKEIGLHIYHIEKFTDKKRFYQNCLAELNKRVCSLQETNKDLQIIGFSGLCVTSQGIGLFYNKFNCREREFINSEHILRKDDQLEIFDTESNSDLQNKLEAGYEYLNRCKMLVLYPSEPSIVWRYL